MSDPHAPDTGAARLATAEYWDRTGYSTRSDLGRRLLPTSFSLAHYVVLLRRYLHPGMHVLEVGVAPGLDLLHVARRLRIEPFGVDYSAPGVRATRANFERAGYPPDRIVHADLFSAAFQSGHRERYDAVLSVGFVEHFKDPSIAIRAHLSLLKPGGVAFISVPNFTYLGRWLPPPVLAIHNTSIMAPDALARTVVDGTVVAKGYFGGLFNFGVIFSRQALLERARQAIHLVQRLTVDQIQRGLLAFDVALVSTRFTPSIYVVVRAPDAAAPASPVARTGAPVP